VIIHSYYACNHTAVNQFEYETNTIIIIALDSYQPTLKFQLP